MGDNTIFDKDVTINGTLYLHDDKTNGAVRFADSDSQLYYTAGGSVSIEGVGTNQQVQLVCQNEDDSKRAYVQCNSYSGDVNIGGTGDTIVDGLLYATGGAVLGGAGYPTIKSGAAPPGGNGSQSSEPNGSLLLSTGGSLWLTVDKKWYRINVG